MDLGTAIRSGISAMLATGMMAAFSATAETTAGASPTAEPASLGLLDQALMKLDEKSFTVGLAYLQVTYKSTHTGAAANAQITDNGAPSPILELNSKEKILHSWTLPLGGAIIGWDINASASAFDTRYQLVNSAFRGQDIGTRVSGGYLGLAPTLFVKMGPLYPGRDIYWKLGYGIGPALFQGSGTASFGGTIHDVGSSATTLAVYQAVNWQFQIDHWNLYITGKIVLPQGSERTSLEAYGAGVAYRFGF